MLLKNNKHWSGLHRLGSRICENIERLREALLLLLDESVPIEGRLKEAVDKGFVVIEGQRSGYSVYTLLEECKAAAEFHCDISVKAFPSQII